MNTETTWLTLPNGKKLEIPYHHSNNLPMIFENNASANLHLLSFDDLSTASVRFNVADERNQNLSEAQKELLLNHKFCSHANMQWMQELMQPRSYLDDSGKTIKLRPVLLTKHESTKSCKPCKCAACLLAKAKRRSTEITTTHSKFLKEMALKEGHVFSGLLIHADQYESSVKGRRYETYGRERELDKYRGGTIFCDSMSTLIYVTYQVSLRAANTLAG